MDIIDRAARLFGSAPALRMNGRIFTFDECAAKALRIAFTLYSKGIRPGNIVAIVSPNTPDMALLLLGLLKAGIIAAPVNCRFPEHLIRTSLEKLTPRLVVTGGKEPVIKLPGITTVSIASILDDASLCKAPDAFDAPETMDRPVTIIHTSASSGQAKAALHSFANHWYSALGSNENLPFGPGECWLLSLPLYHIGGYALIFRSLISGGAIAIGEPADNLSHLLQQFPVTHLSLVPTQLFRLLADSKNTALTGRLKAVLLGGSSAPKTLIDDAVRQNIPLYLSYGSTEMSSQIATTPGPVECLQQNSGRVLPYREIMAADDGELLVRGECLFPGYLRQGVIEPQTDREGWFHTADIGFVTGDGRVTVLGRKDNMFISGGENIHPEEIERALMMIDGIREALVVPVSDQEYGQRPAAFIRTVEENKPDDETINMAMHDMVGKLKTPAIFRTDRWITLPGSQKTDRERYRKLAAEQ